ncbi:hypothetical protein D3C78_962740 [compost metagenome]
MTPTSLELNIALKPLIRNNSSLIKFFLAKFITLFSFSSNPLIAYFLTILVSPNSSDGLREKIIFSLIYKVSINILRA